MARGRGERARRARRSLLGCAGAVLLALTALGCAGSDQSAKLGELETVAGPFGGDIMLDSNDPAVGEHDAELQLDDGEGAPLAGAHIVITPFMPAHGHGSEEVVASEVEPGRYRAQKVWLYMPGVWELRVEVERGEAVGELVATFEVH